MFRAVIIAAAAIFLIAAGPIPLPKPTNQGRPPIAETQSETAQQSGDRNEQSQQALGLSAHNPLYINASCEHGCGYAESDKGWWQKFWTDPNATFAGLLFLLTLGLVVSGFLQWRALIRQDKRLKESIDKAETASAQQSKDMQASIAAAQKAADAAVAAQRPWVKIDIIPAGDMTEDGNGVRLKFAASIQNTGNSPAADLDAWVALTCGGRSVPFDKALAKIPPPVSGAGLYLFPENEPTPMDLYGRLTMEEIDKALADAQMTGHILIGVVASVSYKFMGDEGRTTNFYMLEAKKVLGAVDVRTWPVRVWHIALRKLPIVHSTT
jgi:hypothetical protein